MSDPLSNSNVIQLGIEIARTKFPAVAQTEAYWTALSDGGEVPNRANIDPRGLEDVLEYAFILERIAPGLGRFRVAGGHLNDLMGMEVRGMPISAMFEPQARAELEQLIKRVCDTPAVVEVMLESAGQIGREPLSAKLILAPLCDEAGVVNRLLGCIQSEGRIGRQPRRFAICEVKVLDICAPSTDSSAMATHVGRVAAPDTASEFIAEPGIKKPGKTRPALRLVSDNG